MARHYEFTGAEKQIRGGTTVRQIRALIDLPDTRAGLFTTSDVKNVRAGDLGGWIESATVVDESGNVHPRLADRSWVADDACVYGNARLHGEARVEGRAAVYAHATCFDRSRVSDFARVSGRAEVRGAASLSDHSMAFDDAVIEGNAVVSESAAICQDALVAGNVRVGGSARIRGAAIVRGSSNIFGFVTIEERAVVAADVMICGTFAIGNNALIESSSHLLVVQPIGPRSLFATVMYRTSSRRGEIAHRFDKPWKGSLLEFERVAASFVERVESVDPLTARWRTQYEAFKALAALAEQEWQQSDG